MAPSAPISDEKITQARRLYVETDTPQIEIARLLGLSETTLRRRIKQWGWPPRTARDRRSQRAAAPLADVVPLPDQTSPDPAPAGPEDVRESGADLGDIDRLELARRLERTALRQIMAMEARLARLGLKPQTDAEQERAARTLAVLVRVLRDSQSLRTAQPNGEGEDDDSASGTGDAPPRDLDALRDALAERLENMARARRAERGARGL